MVKIRMFPKRNYSAMMLPSGKTFHWKYHPEEPYGELAFPELYDVAINSKCFGACPYCYISSVPEGDNYKDVVEKALAYFGNMLPNERPFQVAIGGAGEPTLHPDLPEFLKALRELGIVPNYTTNGMHLTPDILEATELYAGGVAVTVHRHLRTHWMRAIRKLAARTKLNLHFIPMSVKDVHWMVEVAEQYEGVVDYFVVLPYQAIGFGQAIDTAEIYRTLFDDVLPNVPNLEQYAYGAGFYEELAKRPHLKADLYPHSVFSKYLDMKGKMTLFNSSYEWDSPIKTNLLAQTAENALHRPYAPQMGQNT